MKHNDIQKAYYQGQPVTALMFRGVNLLPEAEDEYGPLAIETTSDTLTYRDVDNDCIVSSSLYTSYWGNSNHDILVNDTLSTHNLTDDILADMGTKLTKNFFAPVDDNATGILNYDLARIRQIMSNDTSGNARRPTFHYLPNVTHITNFRTNNSIWKAFTNLENIEDMSNIEIDASKFSGTAIYETFANCYKLKHLPVFTDATDKLTTLYGTFYKCRSLESIDLTPFTGSKITNMTKAFYECKSLESIDLSPFAGSTNVKAEYTFTECNNLELLEFSTITFKPTVLTKMFAECNKLKTLDLSHWNLNNITSIFDAFRSCYDLESINFGVVSFSIAGTDSYTYNGAFQECTSLIDVTGTLSNIKFDMYLKHSPLTNASAMVFINGLANVTSTKTITFKSTTYNTLTEEQLAIATSRGWSVVSA